MITPTNQFVNELGIKHDHCKSHNAALNNILRSALVFNDNKKHEEDTCQEKLKIQDKECKNTIDELEKQNDQLKKENDNQGEKCKSTIEQLKKQIEDQVDKAIIDELSEKNNQLNEKVKKLEATLETLADMARGKSYYHMPEQQDFEYIGNDLGTVLSQDLHYY